MCLAIPGKILQLTDDTAAGRKGKISFGGMTKEIDLCFVPEAVVGNFVLVHAGFALNVIDEEEAGRTFEYLRQIVELKDVKDQTA